MLFAIGDVHGHAIKLRDLFDHCRNFAAARGSRHCRFILLGDYIDRGPDSRGVMEFLSQRPPDVQAIIGNHEDLLLRSLDEPAGRDVWLANGGFETLSSYEVEAAEELPRSHIELMRALPVFIDDGVRLFVHAGINVGDPAGRDRHTLLWTRKTPPDDMHLPRFLVHGHTPVRNGKPDLRPNRLNLDTGAGWGRDLTAAAFEEEAPRPIAFLSHHGHLALLPPVDS